MSSQPPRTIRGSARAKRVSAVLLGAGAVLLAAALLSTLFAVALASAKPQAGKQRHVQHRRSPNPGSLLPAPGSVARFNREAYAYSSKLSLAQEARRYSILVLQAPYGKLVRRLRHYNPRLQIYMYQFIMYARADDPQGLELCTSLPDVRAHDWFLRGADGRPLRYGPAYGLDFGLPSFQRSCAAHAVALAKRFGFDGVFLDGVGSKPDYEFGGPVAVPRYPTEGRWMAAMYSFLQTMSATVHARGLKVIANIAAANVRGAWSRWTALLDGSEEESWTDGGLGLAQQRPWWQEKLQNAAWSEAHGKYVLLHSFNKSEAANVYGLASMLLIAQGHSTYSTSNADSVGQENWFPEYRTAERLGRPRGGYLRLPGGVYERVFAGGLVLVNPTSHVTRPVRLHGRYSGSGLSHATSATLRPTSGVILLRG